MSLISKKTAAAWGIKLGSGGRCVPFCEERRIIGVGWKMVNSRILMQSSREELWNHVKDVCEEFYHNDKQKIGQGTGQLFRFAQECAENDYVFYYDPPRKVVRICKVVSPVLYRDFDLNDDVDIWHYRKVEYPLKPIPILDFYGSLKGKLLGPRFSFWRLIGGAELAETLIRGDVPGSELDKEFDDARKKIKDILIKRAEALNPKEWEFLIADFLRSKGAYVDEHKIGKDPIIDVEARFDHGEFGEELWRIQVKCLKDRPIDWKLIEKDFKHISDSQFAYVSVFGFTESARQEAEANNILLLEAGDFSEFFLSGKMRDSLKQKLRLTGPSM